MVAGTKAFGVLAEGKTYGYMPSVDVELVGDEMTGYTFATTSNIAYTFEQVGPASYTIQAPNGQYVIMTGNYNSFNLSDTLPENGGGLWMFEMNYATGEAKIINAYSNKWIQYDSNYNTFGAYAEDKGTLPIFYYAMGAQYQSDETGHWTLCSECNTPSEKVAHSGGSANCASQAMCDACGTSYGDLGDHKFESNWVQFNATHHWIECDYCNAQKEGSYAEHSYEKVSENGVDTMTCSCGDSYTFNTAVSAARKEFLVTATDAALDLTGVSDYTAIVSIKVGTIDLGSSIEALDLTTLALEANRNLHGEQNVIVTVLDEKGNEHEISVPVLIVTQHVATKDALIAVTTYAENKPYYGRRYAIR